MKKLLVSIAVLIMCGIGIQADAVAPSKIVGLNSECDTNNTGCVAIPLTLSTLCTASCPASSQPSLTDTNRFWGSLVQTCRTSTDGGTTWGNCGTQPFAGGTISVAGAADGGVLAAGTPVADCLIRRSTDNGSNWVTITTVIGVNCNAAGYGSLLRCRSDGNCILPFYNSTAGNCLIYTSSDSGASWNTGVAGIVCSIADAVSTTWDGVTGVVVSRAHAGSQQSWSTTGGVWGISANWPINFTCTGSMILNGVIRSICRSVADGSWQMKNAAGVTQSTVTFPGANSAANSGPLTVSIGTGVVYAFVPFFQGGPLPIGVYVSRDSGTTFGLAASTPTTTNSMNGGDAYFHNGCIYVSAGTVPHFFKVC